MPLAFLGMRLGSPAAGSHNALPSNSSNLGSSISVGTVVSARCEPARKGVVSNWFLALVSPASLRKHKPRSGLLVAHWRYKRVKVHLSCKAGQTARALQVHSVPNLARGRRSRRSRYSPQLSSREPAQGHLSSACEAARRTCRASAPVSCTFCVLAQPSLNIFLCCRSALLALRMLCNLDHVCADGMMLTVAGFHT